MATKKKKEPEVAPLVIARPNLQTVTISIRGTAPYVQHKFSAKARQQMLQAQMDGAKSKNRKKTEPRDPEADYQNAQHVSTEGWVGIPAPAFRSACIRACQLVGINMTMGRMSVFVLPDGFDADDGTPLVRIHGDPEKVESTVRLATGVASVAIRPMWREWSAKVRVTFDGDQFSAQDVVNLMHRAGLQVGVGEGRPFSKKSDGMGWGTFEIDEEAA
jgi:hypothetical protein